MRPKILLFGKRAHGAGRPQGAFGFNEAEDFTLRKEAKDKPADLMNFVLQ